MSPRPDDRRLGCGRDIDDVWASMHEAPDEHERECAFCQEARASMTPLVQATEQLRAADLRDPDLQPDTTVLTRVMQIARAEVRRGKRLPLDEPEPDQPTPQLTISEQTVAASARRAADSVAGVQVRRSRVTLATSTSSSSDVGAAPTALPAGVDIALQVSVSMHVSIPTITHQVRQAVRAAIAREVGMNPVTVDITVQDVHDV